TLRLCTWSRFRGGRSLTRLPTLDEGLHSRDPGHVFVGVRNLRKRADTSSPCMPTPSSPRCLASVAKTLREVRDVWGYAEADPRCRRKLACTGPPCRPKRNSRVTGDVVKISGPTRSRGTLRLPPAPL